jgi:hypothetical protein
MDYKAFLKPAEPLVLPYFGGARVDSVDRRFAVQRREETQIEPGWWRFAIEGRRAVPKDPAAPVDLGALPSVRGHWVDGWVVSSGRELGRIALAPADEPSPLAKVTARRWYSGDLLFDSLEFEDDAETTARLALEERRPLGAIKGVVPSLRAAFGYALGLTAAAQLKIEVSIRELTPIVVEIADGGMTVVAQLFDDLVQRRIQMEQALREREARAKFADAARSAKSVVRKGDGYAICDHALDSADARMLAFRRIANNTQFEVTYTVDGERIISTVAAETLQVLDPGVCLANAHSVLTLDAMPSVIREAVEDGVLVITRRS